MSNACNIILVSDATCLQAALTREACRGNPADSNVVSRSQCVLNASQISTVLAGSGRAPVQSTDNAASVHVSKGNNQGRCGQGQWSTHTH